MGDYDPNDREVMEANEIRFENEIFYFGKGTSFRSFKQLENALAYAKKQGLPGGLTNEQRLTSEQIGEQEEAIKTEPTLLNQITMIQNQQKLLERCDRILGRVGVILTILVLWLIIGAGVSVKACNDLNDVKEYGGNSYNYKPNKSGGTPSSIGLIKETGGFKISK